MGTDSAIQWTAHTFNPWRGCTKVSPGCAHCYAEKMSGRNPKVLGVWGKNGARAIAAESYWRQPIAWNKAAATAGERHRVFCASLADVFEADDTMPPSAIPAVRAARVRLFDLIRTTPHLDWLLLTKRPENVDQCLRQVTRFVASTPEGDDGNLAMWLRGWQTGVRPPENIWLGTSCENQQTADERIPHLLRCPAAIRFLSAEPLLGPIILPTWRCESCGGVGSESQTVGMGRCHHCGHELDGGADDIGFGRWLHLVIVGGESGPGARPMHPQWARSIRDQCQAASVPFFFKQWGEHVPWDCRHTTGEQADAISASGRLELHTRMMPDGTFPSGKCTREEMDRYMSEGVHMLRVGKKAAGRLLDGRTWDEMPQSPQPTGAER